jgi:chromosome segregation ATPase
MLHIAYQNLAPKERNRVDAMIEAAYASSDDPRLKQLVSFYSQAEPDQRDNELHSLLGTEVGTLSPELERYYARYFADRQQVVKAFQSYDFVFTVLKNQYDELNGQLTAMKGQLDDLRSRQQAAASQAASLGNQIDALRAQDRIEESNTLVPPQNAAADEANNLRDQYNALVDHYNDVVRQINAVAQRARDIFNQLSSVPVQLGRE